ncbi:MAG: acylphosphatase [Pseudomonadales bacterium]
MDDYREHLFISGFVQMVGYRDFTRRMALKYELYGWCRNLADGRVEAMLCGAQDNVLKCIADLKKGPQLARVNHIDRSVTDDDTDYFEFEIKR